jgi:hypothetical protein
MKLTGIISTAVLSLLLGVAAPLYAQEQHDEQKDQKEEKEKPAKPDEKRAQPEAKKAPEAKPAKPEQEKAAQENKNVKEEKNTQQHQQQAKSEEHARPNRIPDDRFRANFGREHTFRVSQGDYRDHHFRYGGYSFGFVDPWPANWLYTQDVFVVEINGIYYLCNAAYPGVNLTLSFTL